ncbi:hypothetical protein GCM10007205_06520 [Oxalicibacterium flavum]|uniref:Intradiol ring-cleavage dioxygenases domain-containing protein n=1 Tax=Oxalicibacterium flavum TaxID=179467 RepID=A0A8J2UPB4_9BURK|nr:intradiol ring-cleavage dioxygenase [Oxalicibacterium flavum]GGB99900.1 hypothetical protein GCM10007205_06520 [Oxalicibacterium flavum]
MNTPDPKAPISSFATARRKFLRLAGLLAVPPSLLLSACSTRSATTATAASANIPPAGSWLQGGTRAITAAARAIDPFAAGLGTSCTLTCEATIGPCHTTSPERTDVSDGWDGIPMRLLLRVVDTGCKPVPDAIVEIWHTNHTGGYSGRIEAMCNNDQADLDKQFFRGYQRTDADGVVRFDSCFPGWYRGRVNHVHFRIMTGAYDADDRAAATLVSQLVFTDALNAAIFGNEPLYRELGLPDTLLSNDNVMGGESDHTPYLFDVQQVEGVMIASKTVTVRTGSDQATCSVKDGAHGGPGGPGGFGGPPPGLPPDGRRGPPPGRL